MVWGFWSKIFGRHVEQDVNVDENDKGDATYEPFKTEVIKVAWYEDIVDGAKNNGKKLYIDVEPLCKLLLRPDMRDLPVVVYSINGRMRTGKSFLLNQVIKYLKSESKKNWIDEELDNPFQWNDDCDGVTSGIQIWPEPFVVNTNQGKRVVILVDTQGIHDGHSSQADTHKIFGLSALMSSVVIYNDKVKSDDIFFNIHAFLDFTNSVQADSRHDDEDEEEFLFGKLILLQRDWQHHRKFPYGFYTRNGDRMKLWKQLLWGSKQLSEDGQKHRASITKSFTDVSFFAMAGPGNKFPDDPEYQLSSTWDDNFRTCVVDFVETVFSPSYIEGSNKFINENYVLAKEYVVYLKNWVTEIYYNDYDLSQSTIISSVAMGYYQVLITQSWEMYCRLLADFRAEKGKQSIDKFHEDAMKKIHAELWKNVKYRHQRKTYLEEMESQLSKFHGENKKRIEMEARVNFRRQVIFFVVVGAAGVFSGGIGYFVATASEIVISICVGSATVAGTYVALKKPFINFISRYMPYKISESVQSYNKSVSGYLASQLVYE